MRRTNYLIFTLFLFSSCDKNGNEIACIPDNLENHVIAFYPFSNGSINDFSGNGNHLSNPTSASASLDRHGNANCAFEFDNLPVSSEFLINSNTSFLNNLNEFSISLWYQPKDSTRNGADFESLVSRGTGVSCPDRYGEWSLGLYDCRRAVFGRTNSVWDTASSNPSCVLDRTGIWNHAVATLKLSTVEMKIYRNGILQESSLGDGNCGSGPVSVQDIGDLFLGKDYTGILDDVILFNKTLSQQDVNTLLGMGTCCQ